MVADALANMLVHLEQARTAQTAFVVVSCSAYKTALVSGTDPARMSDASTAHGAHTLAQEHIKMQKQCIREFAC